MVSLSLPQDSTPIRSTRACTRKGRRTKSWQWNTRMAGGRNRITTVGVAISGCWPTRCPSSDTSTIPISSSKCNSFLLSSASLTLSIRRDNPIMIYVGYSQKIYIYGQLLYIFIFVIYSKLISYYNLPRYTSYTRLLYTLYKYICNGKCPKCL